MAKAPLLAFRAMLSLYPRGFRETYADAMEMVFLDRLRESRAPVPRAPFWLRTSSNIALTACGDVGLDIGRGH